MTFKLDKLDRTVVDRPYYSTADRYADLVDEYLFLQDLKHEAQRSGQISARRIG